MEKLNPKLPPQSFAGGCLPLGAVLLQEGLVGVSAPVEASLFFLFLFPSFRATHDREELALPFSNKRFCG